MAGIFENLFGTTGAFFKLGIGGPRLKNNGGAIEAKNNGDTGFVNLTGDILKATGDDIVINSDAAGTGADWSLTVSRNAAATANLKLVAPPAKGTDGHLLRQKAGTAAGVLELE